MVDSRSVGGTGLRQIAAELLVVAAIGMALGGLGPFGSYSLPLAVRLAFWTGFILIGYAIFRPMVILRPWLARAAAIPPIGADLLILTVGSFALTLLIGWALSFVRPGSLSERFGILYIQVWAIGLAVDLFMIRMFGAGTEVLEPAGAASAPEPEPERDPKPATLLPLAPARPAFFERLPPSFGPRLYCLSVEDHYVRAHGSHGSALLLMRLRDAVAELGETGMQVHRSWWVADDAIERIERGGRAVQLVLANGLRVPVARQYAAAVRQRLSGRAAAA